MPLPKRYLAHLHLSLNNLLQFGQTFFEQILRTYHNQLLVDVLHKRTKLHRITPPSFIANEPRAQGTGKSHVRISRIHVVALHISAFIEA